MYLGGIKKKIYNTCKYVTYIKKISDTINNTILQRKPSSVIDERVCIYKAYQSPHKNKKIPYHQ